MGASAWSHFGPYRENLVEAFQLLCQKVFEEGDYYHLWVPPAEQRRRAEETVDRMIAREGLDYSLDVYQMNRKGITPRSREDLVRIFLSDQTEPPRTIQELVRYNELDGTHSVLDFTFSWSDSSWTLLPPEEAARYLEPISEKALLRVFGTTMPTRSMITEAQARLWDYLLDDPEGGSEGTYIVVYKDGVPHEIFVMGISGD